MHTTTPHFRFENVGSHVSRELAAQALERIAAKQHAFLTALETLGTVKGACDAVGIGRRTAYDWLERDQQFTAAFDFCYHANATFRDIAFELHGRGQIHKMWQMICAGDITAAFEVVSGDQALGRARVVDTYTFSDTGRRVRNVIESTFRFSDGLIIEHRDNCDSVKWAEMAIGGVGGFLAGHLGPLRKFKASRKLQKFTPHATTVRLA